MPGTEDLEIMPVVELVERPVRPVSVSATNTGGKILSRECLLFGWCFLETTDGAGAQVDLYDGQDGNGQYIASVTLAAGGSVVQYVGQPGIHAKSGLYAKVVKGSVQGSVYVRL